jgi:hypothetical protein
MAQVVRQKMARHDDARSLLHAVYSTEVDLMPDLQAKTLTVRLHPLANTSSDETLRHLCTEINTTEPLFPGTGLPLIYELVQLLGTSRLRVAKADIPPSPSLSLRHVHLLCSAGVIRCRLNAHPLFLSRALWSGR